MERDVVLYGAKCDSLTRRPSGGLFLEIYFGVRHAVASGVQYRILGFQAGSSQPRGQKSTWTCFKIATERRHVRMKIIQHRKLLERREARQKKTTHIPTHTHARARLPYGVHRSPDGWRPRLPIHIHRRSRLFAAFVYSFLGGPSPYRKASPHRMHRNTTW